MAVIVFTGRRYSVALTPAGFVIVSNRSGRQAVDDVFAARHEARAACERMDADAARTVQ